MSWLNNIGTPDASFARNGVPRKLLSLGCALHCFEESVKDLDYFE